MDTTNRKTKTRNLQDFLGHQLGRLTVIAYVGTRKTSHGTNSHRFWKCQCACGNIIELPTARVKIQHGCGCLMHKRGLANPLTHNLIGQKFGRLTVLEFAPYAKSGGIRWYCRCDCGQERIVDTSSLKTGNTKSCGCFGRELATAHIIHGDCAGGTSNRAPEYNVWMAMLSRCRNKTNPEYKNYGGRGITVCEQWKRYVAFLEDMKRRPTPEHTLERKDVNGHYEPSNCIWIHRSEQAKNRRDSMIVEHNGEKRCASEWARMYNTSPRRFIERLKRGWVFEDAVSFPPDMHKRYRPSGL